MAQHHLTQSLFDHKGADISCNVLNTVVRVTRQDGRVGTEQVSMYRLLTPAIAGGLGASADQHHDRGSDRTSLA